MYTKVSRGRCPHRPAIKRIVSLILSLAMFYTLTAGLDFSVFAEEITGKCGDNVTYTIDTETQCLVISGTGAMYDYDVKGPWWQKRYVVKSLIVSDGVTSIGDVAFSGMTNLLTAEIAESVVSVGALAFLDCHALKKINIPSKITRIEDGTFCECWDLIDFTIPDGVVSISDYAFNDCYDIQAIELPQNLKSIGEYAFEGCRELTDIKLPDTIESIGVHAFRGCSKLTEFDVPPCVTEIIGTFQNCVNLTQVVIPKGITFIGNDTFDSCDSLTDIYYGGSEVEWNNVGIGTNNESLLNAVIHCSDGIINCEHQIVIDKAVEPTCTSTGLTEGSHCSICNRVIVKQEIIPEIPHNCEWINDNGCVVKKCTVCNDELSRLPFTDLADTDYRLYGDYIEYTSVNNSFIIGTNPPANTVFSPTRAIDRAMMVTILYRMAGEPYANGANPYESTPFSDITNTNVYYYDAACWALKNGITTETTFKPFDNVSREQTASFLFRYAKKNNMLGDEAYKNVNLADYPDFGGVHSWAVEPLQWANYNGMITGTQQGTADPQGATQRIHAAKILYGFGKLCHIGNFE